MPRSFLDELLILRHRDERGVRAFFLLLSNVVGMWTHEDQRDAPLFATSKRRGPSTRCSLWCSNGVDLDVTKGAQSINDSASIGGTIFGIFGEHLGDQLIKRFGYIRATIP